MRAALREWSALLLLIGTIVGVGMFAIPFVFLQAGFLTGLIELGVLAAAVTLIHLCYLEVIEKTPSSHRLPGYVRIYFGRPLGWLSTISYFFSISGALLAYLVLGGFFLGAIVHTIFPAIPTTAGPILFYLFGIFVIFRSIRFEGAANAVLTVGLILTIIVIAASLLPTISAANFTTFHFSRVLIPYGVILFSMTGAAVIPDMRRLFGSGEDGRLRVLIIVGTLLPALLYLLFAFAVVGTTGGATTPDAITGLAERFGIHYLLLGSIIGFLATITSFITLGSVLEGMFAVDLKLKRRTASVIVALIPAALYLLGLKDFIAVMSVVGALALGFDSILLLALHRKITRSAYSPDQRSGPFWQIARPLLFFMFGVGIVLELFTLAAFR